MSYLYLSGEGGGNYDRALFTTLERLEHRSFWFRSRNDLIVWALRRYRCGGIRFLEVGCGTGFVLAAIHARIPELDVVGAELYPEGIEVGRRRLPGVPLVQMSVLEIPFEGSFDAIGAFDVLEHIDDDERALAEMRDAVADGGLLLVTVPQHPRLWSAADDFAGHVRRYEKRELVEKVRKAGWDPVRVTSFVSLSLPLFAVSRALRARHDGTYDLEAELRLPAALDHALDRLMSGERALIARGMSFPVGASLLVVANRMR